SRHGVRIPVCRVVPLICSCATIPDNGALGSHRVCVVVGGGDGGGSAGCGDSDVDETRGVCGGCCFELCCGGDRDRGAGRSAEGDFAGGGQVGAGHGDCRATGG